MARKPKSLADAVPAPVVPDAAEKPAKRAPKRAAAKPRAVDKQPGSWVICEGATVKLSGPDCHLSKKYLKDRPRQDTDGVRRLDAGAAETTIEFADAKSAFKFYAANANGDHDAIEDGDDTGWYDPSMAKVSEQVSSAFTDD